MAEQPYDIGTPFIDGHVELHIANTCQAWMPWYLGRFDQADGLEPGFTRLPRTYDVSADEARWPEQTPPALLVISPGSLGDFTLEGVAGSLAGYLQINVSVTAGANGEKGSRALAHRYCGAVREILAQQIRGDLIDRVELLGWRNDLIVRKRNYTACSVRAAVRVPRILQTLGDFPLDPPTDGNQPGFTPPTSGRAVVTRTLPAEPQETE